MLNQCAVALASLLAVHAIAANSASASHSARLQPVQCWFDVPSSRQLDCAYFYPSQVSGEPAVRLPVVMIRAQAQGRRNSPILFLPGGPGMPARLDSVGIEGWLNWVSSARWPHDLVLYDPRGTGLSQPLLDCPEIRWRDQQDLLRDLSAEEDLKGLQRSAAECYGRLARSGFRAEDYSTPRQVQDAVELMASLGGQDWNLYGISYGSRLALQVLRQQPDRVRSLVLDSVYPPEINGLSSRPAQFMRAWEDLLAYCRSNPQCDAAHPMLDKRLDTLFAQLASTPIELSVPLWPDGSMELLLNDYRLLWMLFLEGYQPRYQPRLIPAIEAAVAGNFEPWVPIAADYLRDWMDSQFSHAVYLSVTCAEDMPGLTDAAYRKQASQFPMVSPYLSEDWRLSACHRWPVASAPLSHRQAVESSVPVLMLTGHHDVATLPEWASGQVSNLSRAHHVIFDGSSHGVTWANPCAMAVAWEFLGNPLSWPLPPCLSASERSTMHVPRE